jgi:hypothetical protein
MIRDVVMIREVAVLVLFVICLAAGAAMLVVFFGVALATLFLPVALIAVLAGSGALIWYEISSGSPEPRDFAAIAVLWIILAAAYRFRLWK